MSLKSWWSKLFFEEKPSISLGLFRVVVALTTSLHLIPAFFHLEDTFFSTALKTHNYSFYPPWFVELVDKSPDQLVIVFVVLFCVSCFSMIIGFFSQISCILMTACCYYFYALNDYAVGHILTWDILMVTLFLMCLTPYPGDYFSVDCLRRADVSAYKHRRPYFLQRLLQMQVAFTYFYTGLYKITGPGNWIKDNPIYYLVNYPVEGVTKLFLLKDWMAAHPHFCYITRLLIVAVEISMPFLLFFHRTRISAIYLGIVFHLLLILTLDVPSIFFFLFPPMLLLFIDPDNVIRWIEQKRLLNQNNAKQAKLVYDGNCQFCRASVRTLQIMDLFSTLKIVDYQKFADREIHPDLTREQAHSQVYLIEPDGTLYGGFFVFRRLCLTLPMMYPLILIFYFPGAGIIGPRVYSWVAQNRYLFHFNKTCHDNACFIR